MNDRKWQDDDAVCADGQDRMSRRQSDARHTKVQVSRRLCPSGQSFFGLILSYGKNDMRCTGRHNDERADSERKLDFLSSHSQQ